MTNCIFCDIVNKKINAYIISENNDALAFLDINPLTRGHIIVIPKIHYDNLTCCESNVRASVFDLAAEIAKKLQGISNLKIKGFNFISNQNRIAGQVIDHFHVHLIPRYENDGLKFDHKSIEYNLDDFYHLINTHFNK